MRPRIRALHSCLVAALVGLLIVCPTMSWSQPITVDLTAPPGPFAQNATVDVSINVGADVTGLGILGFVVDVTFDPAFLTYTDHSACPTGGATIQAPGWLFMASVPPSTPGIVSLAGVGGTPLSGAGCLHRLQFRVTGSAPLGQCSTPAITRMTFNAGTPAAVPLNPATICVTADVSGSVIYAGGECRGPGASAATGVPTVRVTVKVNGTTAGSSMTPDAGTYSIAVAGSSAKVAFQRTNSDQDYLITSDVGRALTVNDAALVLQYLIHADPLDDCTQAACSGLASSAQREAADVDRDGTVTPLDGGLIQLILLQQAIGTTQRIPTTAGLRDWRFFCNNVTVTLPLSSPVVAKAVIPGDVTLNYANDPSKVGKPRENVTVAVSRVERDGTHVIVPIDLQGEVAGALGAQTRLKYDPEVLRFASATEGPAAKEFTVLSGGDPGTLGLVLVGREEIGQGRIAYLHFERVAGSKGRSPLLLEFARVGEEDVQTQSGVFDIDPVATEQHTWGQIKTLYR